MGTARLTRPDLTTLALLGMAMEEDDGLPAPEREVRDREAARSLDVQQPRERVLLDWLAHVQARSPELSRIAARLQGTVQASSLVLFALGLLLGTTVTLGVFYYEGEGRVNVLAALTVLVVVPALMLLPLLWMALPGRVTSALPGGAALSALLRALNPARVGAVVARGLPRRAREAWRRIAQRGGMHQELYGEVHKWVLLRGSQLVAVGFHCAALFTAFGLVLFSDLVFGWSTTLASGDPAADARVVEHITSLVAAPWAGLLESAAPSQSLIEESRYYRAVDGTLTRERAARLGQWWPFVLMAIAVYGLAPRLLTTALAQHQLQRATRAAFASTPGTTGLLSRLHRASVESTAARPAHDSGAAPGSAAATPAAPVPERPPSFPAVVNWSGVPAPEHWLQAHFPGAEVHRAGGGASLAEDRAVREQLASTPPDAPVAVVVKAWEPPLLDIVDFLQDLREQLGRGRDVWVFPLDLDAAGRLVSPERKHLDVWRRRLATKADPWLFVVPFSGPGTTTG